MAEDMYDPLEVRATPKGGGADYSNVSSGGADGRGGEVGPSGGGGDLPPGRGGGTSSSGFDRHPTGQQVTLGYGRATDAGDGWQPFTQYTGPQGGRGVGDTLSFEQPQGSLGGEDAPYGGFVSGPGPAGFYGDPLSQYLGKK